MKSVLNNFVLFTSIIFGKKTFSGKEFINIEGFKKKLLSPYCIKKDNEVFLFYAKDKRSNNEEKNTNIFLTKSKDLKYWRTQTKPVIEAFSPKSNLRTLSPSIARINNEYVMVFEGRSNNSSSIFYANSNNLEDWTINKTPLLEGFEEVLYHSPFILKNELNKEVYIYFCKKVKNQSFIILNIYDDNKFKKIASSRKIIYQTNDYESYSIYAPYVFKLGHQWIMLYAAWSKTPLKGRIMMAKSNDGQEWVKNKEPLIEPSFYFDKKHCSEPAFLEFHDTYYIFYEGCDNAGNWSIIKKKISKII